MRKLRLVFSTLKEHHARQGRDAQDYPAAAGQKPATGKRLYFPLVVYLGVLRRLGLTRPYPETDGTVLTPKGVATDATEIKGLRPVLWLVIYIIKESVIFVVLWPIFLVQRSGRNWN